MTNREKIDCFKLMVEKNSKRYLNKRCTIHALPNSFFSQVAGTKKRDKDWFIIKFNPLKLKSEIHILHVVLHELGHIKHWIDVEDEIFSEYLAESWALLIVQQFYPNEYPMILEASHLIIPCDFSPAHSIGYYEALRSIGEIKDG